MSRIGSDTDVGSERGRGTSATILIPRWMLLCHSSTAHVFVGQLAVACTVLHSMLCIVLHCTHCTTRAPHCTANCRRTSITHHASSVHLHASPHNLYTCDRWQAHMHWCQVCRLAPGLGGQLVTLQSCWQHGHSWFSVLRKMSPHC
jgi:hypothetical protein